METRKIQATSEIAQCNKSSHRSHKSPLISCIYNERNRVIRRLLDCSLRSHNGPLQLLNIGAGLDQQYDNLFHSVYCVDHDNVIEQRRKDSAASHVEYIGCDIRQTKTLMALLHKHGFQFGRSTVVLMECVLCYVERNFVEELLKALSDGLSTATVVLYDPILRPSEGVSFASHLISSFQSWGVPSQPYCQSLEGQSELLQSCGWPHQVVVTMGDALRLLVTSDNSYSPQLVDPSLFDEYAAVCLLRQQYCISLASSDSNWFQKTWQDCVRIPTGVNTENIDGRRWDRLIVRLRLAELRLSTVSRAWERSKSEIGRLVVEEMTQDASQWNDYCLIYEKAFSVISTGNKSIQKFVHRSLKDLRSR